MQNRYLVLLIYWEMLNLQPYLIAAQYVGLQVVQKRKNTAYNMT